MKTDYSELVGKTLIWRYTSGKEVLAKVDGCDYSIGITISEADNPDHRLCCYNGPLSPVWKHPFKKYDGTVYRKLFHQTIKEIKAGLMDGVEYNKFRKSFDWTFTSKIPTVENCAFSQ